MPTFDPIPVENDIKRYINIRHFPKGKAAVVKGSSLQPVIRASIIYK